MSDALTKDQRRDLYALVAAGFSRLAEGRPVSVPALHTVACVADILLGLETTTPLVNDTQSYATQFKNARAILQREVRG